MTSTVEKRNELAKARVYLANSAWIVKACESKKPVLRQNLQSTPNWVYLPEAYGYPARPGCE